MSLVTICVPTFQGERLLDECLSCLARQTFEDFVVNVCDNGSTDATPEIAAAWARRDKRFTHVRRESNVGLVANYRDALQACQTPWFMWRADDDLSADNYVEALVRLATNSPGCKLAASTVLSCDLDGGRRRLNRPPAIRDPASVSGRMRMLFGYHYGWFYGLWDRETILNVYLPICANFPFAFAADQLTLYGPIIDGIVRTTEETEFIQRARRTAATPRRGTRMPFSLMAETRSAYRRELRRIRSERHLPGALRAALVASEPFYLERTVPSLAKMARTKLRESLGLAGRNQVGRHFERGK
ncbi:MAG: glycosyltransferase family 2 protein [Bradyrhizobium sp.]|nr:MAG: glycosyltransferase family 2 protein [Bradyrhizobium sp.]